MSEIEAWWRTVTIVAVAGVVVFFVFLAWGAVHLDHVYDTDRATQRAHDIEIERIRASAPRCECRRVER